MKKKLATALFAITLSVTMAACSGKEPSNIKTPAVTEKPTEPSNSSSNKESEKYIKLKNGEEISLEGMNGFTTKAVSINGKFVLFGNNVPQELVDAFNSFK